MVTAMVMVSRPWPQLREMRSEYQENILEFHHDEASICFTKNSFAEVNIFGMCFKSPWFTDFWNVSFKFLCLRMLGRVEIYHTVHFSFASTIFKKLAHGRHVKHLEKSGLFSDS